MRAKVSKSHSSFCTAVPGEGRGPLDLEALAEGADTGIHNADFVSKQPASRLVLPHQPFLLPSPWFPFTATARTVTPGPPPWPSASCYSTVEGQRSALRPLPKSAFPFTSKPARQWFPIWLAYCFKFWHDISPEMLLAKFGIHLLRWKNYSQVS